ncbi:hypothetical protein SAMN06265365_102424 [Tistlia consotensis]|uniref:Glyoxalase/Bleomycin resistance protein/Dioxygenase superfamily protein n=1 Tax=Tistlia consotensis USBA 355 TaxID=560819 RepID=A0A1Y6BZZ1_9PROT|nr:hypothetical protein [Tistlia consotensis]SMF38568.1 hypothetical protein SAMN05428998_11339 [Tistlia consotensis USBA 355]SNR37065.1 hypothetical protein SAMN06265365_102424 [Tistlia consotensis]
MIHHFSLPARDPRRVAEVLAELIGGRAYRFTGPLPGAFMAVSGDAHGTMIEVYPETAVLAPGEADQPVVFRTVPTEAEGAPRLGAFHVLLSVPLDRAAIERIGAAAGWRTRLFGRGAPGQPPVFSVIEVWVENRIMLEVAPADMIATYESFMQPARLDALGLGAAPAEAAR